MMHFVKRNPRYAGPWITICSHKWPVWGNEATRTWKYINCPECLKLRPVIELGELEL